MSKAYDLQTNYQTNPLGIDLSDLVFSWKNGGNSENMELLISTDESFAAPVYSRMVTRSDGVCFAPDYEFEDGKKYFWKVGDSEVSSFEGGHPSGAWIGKWIKPAFSEKKSPVFKKSFRIDKLPEIARLYICGLGLYEVYINGEKVGNDFLTPYFTDYRYWIQYQTYDVKDYLNCGDNLITVILGDGWYKGRLGFSDGGHVNHYGTDFMLLCDLYMHGDVTNVIGTDASWLVEESPVVMSNIYDGEVWDDRVTDIFALPCEDSNAVIADAPQGMLTPMTGLNVRRHETLTPVKIITSVVGETILDFGQEITGWVKVNAKLKKDESVTLSYGEILQDGKFYQDNLRTAKARYTYTSNGDDKDIRPHFTFFGFRYVRVEGIKVTDTNINDFEAWALYSDLKETGAIVTDNEKINRLILNTKWSQKGNFLDVPTDCPQRDERLGWTGDAQVFSSAASYHMQTPVFYRKYLRDMLYEQRGLKGSVPFVVPDVLTIEREQDGQPEYDYQEGKWGEAGSSGWGDAATVIPWNNYIQYGNKKWLDAQYENMTAWVSFLKHVDEDYCDGTRLINCGFHFGDWLALDTTPDNLQGGTDPFYIASAYYMLSSRLTYKAAKVLGKVEEAAEYKKLSDEIRSAIRKKYVQEDGLLTINTQTAYAVGIEFDVFEDAEKSVAGDKLAELIDENNGKLSTGFIGTAFLLEALVSTNHSDIAYKLLFNEEYPGWLYEVNLGATTIWERWNSVLADGSISDTGMNSLNHYAYGCVVNWIYRWVCGIQFDESAPAGKKMLIKPTFDSPLEHVTGFVDTMVGRYQVSWEKKQDSILIEVDVPIGGCALFMAGGLQKDIGAGHHLFEI